MAIFFKAEYEVTGLTVGCFISVVFVSFFNFFFLFPPRARLVTERFSRETQKKQPIFKMAVQIKKKATVTNCCITREIFRCFN